MGLSAKLVQFNTGTGTANVAVTGVGFVPDLVVCLGNLALTTANSIGTHKGMSVGWATTTGQGSFGYNSGTNGESHEMLRTTKMMTFPRGDSDTERINLGWVSMDADGFTFLVTRSAASEQPLMLFLCLKGGQYSVGSLAARTDTNNIATTGVGFAPLALVLMSSFLTTSTQSGGGGNAQWRGSFGAGTGATARGVVAHEVYTLGGTQEAQTRQDAGKIGYHLTRTGADTFGSGGDHDLVSLDADGFTLNQVTADSAANLELYLAIGASPVTSTPDRSLPRGASPVVSLAGSLAE